METNVGKNMKKIFIVISLMLGMSSSQFALAGLKVVTTTQDLAAIAKAIGGEYVDVNSLTPGTRDPHFSEAKPSMIRLVFRADLLLLIGAELEVGWLPAVLRSARNRDVQIGGKGHLDLSRHVEILGIPSGPVDRSMGDVHGSGNPHYWLNPQNGLKMARAVSEKLIELDAEHVSDYKRNLASFETQLNSKILEWQKDLSFLNGKSVVAYHISLLYLAKTFDFKIVKEVEPKPGISPSASHLAGLVGVIKQQHIQWLIMEPYYEKRSAEYLNRKTGIKPVVIPQSVGAKKHIKNYFDLFDGIVTAFTEAQ